MFDGFSLTAFSLTGDSVYKGPNCLGFIERPPEAEPEAPHTPGQGHLPARGVGDLATAGLAPVSRVRQSCRELQKGGAFLAGPQPKAARVTSPPRGNLLCGLSPSICLTYKLTPARSPGQGEVQPAHTLSCPPGPWDSPEAPVRTVVR